MILYSNGLGIHSNQRWVVQCKALFSLILGDSVSLWTEVSRLEPVTLYDSLSDDDVTLIHMELIDKC